MPEPEAKCGNATLDDCAGRWHPASDGSLGPRMTDFLADLAQRAPDLRLTTAPGDLEFYGRDWTRRWTPAPLAVAFPATIEEVQVIARWASAHRLALVPSGGRTGLSGGCSWIEMSSRLIYRQKNCRCCFDSRLSSRK